MHHSFIILCIGRLRTAIRLPCIIQVLFRRRAMETGFLFWQYHMTISKLCCSVAKIDEVEELLSIAVLVDIYDDGTVDTYRKRER